MSTRVRLSPEQRREQLLDLGMRWIDGRPLEELSVDQIAEEAGVSKGLLYHYFGGKQEYLLAVLRRFSEELYEATAPVEHDDMIHRLRTSLTDFVQWVRQHHTAYVAFREAAQGAGHPEVRAIYEANRSALVDRIFVSATTEQLAEFGIVDSPASRLFARSWSALVEDALMAWLDEPAGLSEEQLIETFTVSLAGVLACVPR